MAGNTFGQLFRITTFGESHGSALGVIIDGCPSELTLCEDDFAIPMAARRPSGHLLSTPRKEPDRVEILSGVFEGRTTGAPITLLIRNKDVNSAPYEVLRTTFRPGHADYTYRCKYGHHDFRGGGRASARLKGSENNDPICTNGFLANRAGGILGGISNGEEIVIRAAVKPIPSIRIPQQTVDFLGNPVELALSGRFDPCAIPRVVPVLKGMVALVITDHLMRNHTVKIGRDLKEGLK